jgi:hypothetical protein
MIDSEYGDQIEVIGAVRKLAEWSRIIRSGRPQQDHAGDIAKKVERRLPERDRGEGNKRSPRSSPLWIIDTAFRTP